MKKIVCLLLALMLCAGSACAEAVEMNGVTLNIPADWRVDNDWQYTEEEMRFLTLSRTADEAPQTILVTQSDISSWDSIAGNKDKMKMLAELMYVALLAKMDVDGAETYTEEYIALRDGGLALKVVFTTGNISSGVVIALSEGKMVILSVNAGKDEAAQCDGWLNQLLLPSRIQETIEAGGLRIGMPAGFVKNDENGMYFNENNEAIKIFTMDATSEGMQKIIAEGTAAGLLLLVLQSQIGEIQYSNMQAEGLEREGLSALIGSMDITVNGNSGCMGTLTALSKDTVVGLSYLGNQGGEKAAAELMKVVTYPLKETESFYVGDMELSYPEGFRIADAETESEHTDITLSNALQPEMYVLSSLMTDEEKAMAPKELLLSRMKEEIGGVTGSGVEAKWEEYEGGVTALHLDWYSAHYDTKYAKSAVWMTAQDQVIRIILIWPDEDIAHTAGVLASMLPALTAGETISKGNVTLCIPRGWQMQESAEENGVIKYAASGADGFLTAYYKDAMYDNLRGMIDGMGVQTALEIYLSMWANEVGIEGITIDYAQSESGVHRVTSEIMYQQSSGGIAYLLDGDALWQIVIESTVGEEEARALLEQVLEQVR